MDLEQIANKIACGNCSSQEEFSKTKVLEGRAEDLASFIRWMPDYVTIYRTSEQRGEVPMGTTLEAARIVDDLFTEINVSKKIAIERLEKLGKS